MKDLLDAVTQGLVIADLILLLLAIPLAIEILCDEVQKRRKK